jgi:hypothetical protein
MFIILQYVTEIAQEYPREKKYASSFYDDSVVSPPPAGDLWPLMGPCSEWLAKLDNP